MNRHTPGPWIIDERYLTCVRSADGTVIANTDEANQYDNARLIAATPDLLEALLACERLIAEALPEFDWGKSSLSADSMRLLNETPGIVRAAIAKAVGTGDLS